MIVAGELIGEKNKYRLDFWRLNKSNVFELDETESANNYQKEKNQFDKVIQSVRVEGNVLYLATNYKIVKYKIIKNPDDRFDIIYQKEKVMV